MTSAARHASPDNVIARESASALTVGVRQMWNEFVEMPGLRLTMQQARRFWSLDERTCEQSLGTLVAVGLLVRGPDGRYGRNTSTAAPARLAKADAARHTGAPLRHAG